MSLKWLINGLSRVPLYVLVGAVFLSVIVVNSAFYLLQSDGVTILVLSERQIIGVVLLFACLPSYLIVMVYVQWRRMDTVLEELVDRVPGRLLNRLSFLRSNLLPLGLVLLIVGLIFGFDQNSFIVSEIFTGSSWSAFDLAFVTSNALLWGSVAAVLAWRVPIAWHLGRVFAALQPDVYRLDQLKPLARLPTQDVLLIAGALAWMPLQSLDAEFRWFNYVPGTIVGLLASAMLFLFPMLGLRRAVLAAKQKRLAEVAQARREVSSKDVAQIELIEAHGQRIRELPNWSIDVRLITRVIAYVVLPPMAWVAAALVENFIDTL